MPPLSDLLHAANIPLGEGHHRGSPDAPGASRDLLPPPAPAAPRRFWISGGAGDENGLAPELRRSPSHDKVSSRGKSPLQLPIGARLDRTMSAGAFPTSKPPRLHPSASASRSTSLRRCQSLADAPSNLAGIPPPAVFPGHLPADFLRGHPVPSRGGPSQPESQRVRSLPCSLNPWDYIVEIAGDAGRATGAGSRKTFDESQLLVLEVVWTIEDRPNVDQRQRLGSWLGVDSRRVTVWFQNRRQERKKREEELAKAGSEDPSTATNASYRSKRGVFDPATGKYRPVSASLIRPPTAAQQAVVDRIICGTIERDIPVEAPIGRPPPPPPPHQYPEEPDYAKLRAVQRPQLYRQPSGSLEHLMGVRERDFGAERTRTRLPLPVRLPDEPMLRNDCLVSLMSSDAPSDPAAPLEDDEDVATETDTDTEDPRPHHRPSSASAELRPMKRIRTDHGQSSLGHGRPPLRRAYTEFGRASSRDLISSLSRTNSLAAYALSLPRATSYQTRETSSFRPGLSDRRYASAQGTPSRLGDTGGSSSFRAARDSYFRSGSSELSPTTSTSAGTVPPTPGLGRSVSFSSGTSGRAMTPRSAGIRDPADVAVVSSPASGYEQSRWTSDQAAKNAVPAKQVSGEAGDDVFAAESLLWLRQGTK